MNPNELSIWMNDVGDHLSMLDQLVEDRKILKGLIEEHLSQFFTWDDIEYNRDFSKITLKYKADYGAVIKPSLHSELGMDWIVSPHYDDSANRVIWIELYPFGLPKEDEIVKV